MLFHFQLVVFDCFKTLEQLGISGDETAHGDESPHYTDIHLDCRL